MTAHSERFRAVVEVMSAREGQVQNITNAAMSQLVSVNQRSISLETDRD